jgi:hypothetical protein
MPKEVCLINNPDAIAIVDAINKLGEKTSSDYVTLFLAITSVAIALLAACFTKHQRDISSRAEKYKIYSEVLDILYFLQKYDGILTEKSKYNFMKLLEIRSLVKAVFSEDAKQFLIQITNNMRDLQTKKGAYEEEVKPEFKAAYESLGIDPNIHDACGVQYLEIREYFKKQAFVDFEKNFVI